MQQRHLKFWTLYLLFHTACFGNYFEHFYVHVIVTNFFIIKPTRCTNFTNLFWHETLHVSDSSSVHHQEFIHCTLSNGVWHKPLLSVQWIISWRRTEALSETCRVSCHNKFWKSEHLVGFYYKEIAHICIVNCQRRRLPGKRLLLWTHSKDLLNGIRHKAVSSPWQSTIKSHTSISDIRSTGICLQNE